MPLYVVFSLESFIRKYKRREKATLWDPNIAQARNLQATIFKLVEETVTLKLFTSFKKWIDSEEVTPIQFVQYIDYLNVNWCEMEREEREKSFNI